eukprot:6866681-Heterocapsa_arctica.AAC.1
MEGAGASGRSARLSVMYLRSTAFPVPGAGGMEVQMASLLLHSVASIPAGSVTQSLFSSRSLVSRKFLLKCDLPMRKASLRAGLLTVGPRDPS